MATDEEIHWYALKVFFNRVSFIEHEFKSAGYETYYAKKAVECHKEGALFYVYKPLVASLLFVRCTSAYLMKYKQAQDDFFMYYNKVGTNQPEAVPDNEMKQFILVTSVLDTGLEYLGRDAPQYHIGDRVRVINGIYKGTEGIIKRIKKDRRLIVTVSGVAVLATSFIHPSFLQKLGQE